MKMLGRMGITVTNSIYICTPSISTHAVAFVFYGFFLVIVSTIGTNLLAHRYMLEKAKVVTALA